MASFTVKSGIGISILVLLAAYYYKKQAEEELKDHLQRVLSGLIRAEKKVKLPHKPKVAVGFGACQDIFANAVEVLDKIGASPPPDPIHINQINSKEDLEKGFAYFFQHGAAAERFVKNETFFDELVEKAASLGDNARWALGGNAPVMAKRFHMEGCNVVLGAITSQALRKHIDEEINVVGAKGEVDKDDIHLVLEYARGTKWQHQTAPRANSLLLAVVGGELEQDDIHLLLEYQRGEQWGDMAAPRANRYIVHSDNNNPYITSLEAFIKEVRVFSPTLLVVGGLQMLDNFPFAEGERSARLGQLAATLGDTPRSTRVHFEMASYAEEACMRDIIDNVVYYSDSLGMNEQELPNLHSILTNGSVTLISDPYPRIATTLDHMRAVYRQLSQTDEAGGKRKLTRLHVHTLAYQAIMTTKGSSWKNTMSAAAKSSLVANRHTCGSDWIHAEKAKILMDDSFSTSRDDPESRRIPLDAERPVACWEEMDVEICIAPVLVCTDVVQTGGGGDNISSAGLVLQI